MNSILVCGRRIAVLVALLSVLLVTFVASASAQDIAVTKFTNSTVVAADSDVSYDVSVSNSTGSTGETTLTDTVPANMTFVSASIPAGWDCGTLPAVGSGGTITCTHAADLPDESSFFFTFVFHVVPGTPNDTDIINTATISNAADNNSANDMSMAMVTVGEPPPPPPPPLAQKDVLISEFRLSGPGGNNDQYIELYCNRNTDCSLAGVKLRAYDPTLPPLEGGPSGGNIELTFPPVVIPARHFLLIGDSAGYSLEPYGFIDLDMNGFAGLVDNEGFQLVAGEEGTLIDSVGFAGGGNEVQYVEGAGLQRATSRPADQYAYVRKRSMDTNGLPQDNDNNSGDFVLVSVTGTPHEGITAPPVLGAPGPKGLSSPISYSNSQITGNLVDPAKSRDDDPNRVRVGSGNGGTMSIRRSFTNNTTDTLFFMTFRVIDITTLNSPVSPGDAEVRLVTSGTTFAEVPSRGAVTIYGTVLEFDAICGCPEPQQPNGGGLNTSAAVNTEQFYLAPGETIDVQFLLNVVTAGFYRFYVYVEAIPGLSESGPTATAADSRARVKQPKSSKFLSVQRVPTASAFKKPKQQTPVITHVTTTSPSVTTVPVRSAATPLPVRNAPTPRVIIINRGVLEGVKKPRKKTRVRRKSSAALQKKAEERFAVAAEKPQN